MNAQQILQRRRVEVLVPRHRHPFHPTLKDLLSVHAADSADRHGGYSQALVSADINALVAVYQNNGFTKVKVTAETGGGAGSDTVLALSLIHIFWQASKARPARKRVEPLQSAAAQGLVSLDFENNRKAGG